MVARCNPAWLVGLGNLVFLLLAGLACVFLDVIEYPLYPYTPVLQIINVYLSGIFNEPRDFRGRFDADG